MKKQLHQLIPLILLMPEAFLPLIWIVKCLAPSRLPNGLLFWATPARLPDYQHPRFLKTKRNSQTRALFLLALTACGVQTSIKTCPHFRMMNNNLRLQRSRKITYHQVYTREFDLTIFRKLRPRLSLSDLIQHRTNTPRLCERLPSTSILLRANLGSTFLNYLHFSIWSFDMLR